MEKDGDEIPEPSKIREIETEENEAIVMIEVDMPKIRMSQENRAVNRTVTLPTC